MEPRTFMAFLDESMRLLIYAKLKAKGYDVEKLMSGEDFFKALERALGRHNLELLMEQVGARAALEANRGLGCPEPLAKAEALAKALVKYLPEEGRRLGEIEMELWELMVQQCAALAAVKQVYTVEEA